MRSNLCILHDGLYIFDYGFRFGLLDRYSQFSAICPSFVRICLSLQQSENIGYRVEQIHSVGIAI